MFSELYTEERILDLYILARYTYRVGEPIMDDVDFNDLEQLIVDCGVSDLYKQSYDDDEVPYDLLKEFGLSHLAYSTAIDEDLQKYLDSEKSLSIRSVENYGDAYRYFMQTPNEDKVISAKINGVNTKSLYSYKDGYSTLQLTMSRGRGGNGMNLTANMSKVVPLKIEDNLENIILFGEAVLTTDGLNYVTRDDNYTLFKNERSAAISLLRTRSRDEFYKYLRVCMFNAEGLSDTLLGTFEKLESLGFFVAPYRFISADEVPKDFTEFTKWLKGIMDYMNDECKKYSLPADGLVVDVNDLHKSFDVVDKYSARNVALKFDHWGYKIYRAKVVRVIIAQQRVKCSFRAEIEPMRTADGCDATYVNLHSPNVVLSEKIKPGSIIYFERNSEAINSLIYGDKLQQLLYGGEVDVL